MEVIVYELYDNRIAHIARNREAADQWINQQALFYNRGMLRSWEGSKATYYDVGPKLYFIEKLYKN